MKTFFFIYREWGNKNPSFHTDFNTVNLIIVKSAHKNSFCQKTVSEKAFCWVKLFLGSLFTKVKCKFDTPFNLLKEKNFHLIEESICTFY
jgi:hypothetical protein